MSEFFFTFVFPSACWNSSRLPMSNLARFLIFFSYSDKLAPKIKRSMSRLLMELKQGAQTKLKDDSQPLANLRYRWHNYTTSHTILYHIPYYITYHTTSHTIPYYITYHTTSHTILHHITHHGIIHSHHTTYIIHLHHTIRTYTKILVESTSTVPIKLKFFLF